MEKIRFVRDDGLEFIMDGSFAGPAPWGILAHSGFGDIEYEITTEKYATGEGEAVTGTYVPKRVLDITADVKDSKNNAEERANALSFFNPKHTFTVYPTHDGITRWITALLQKRMCEPPQLGDNATLNLAMICPDPYFNSMDSYGKDIAATTGGLVFPFVSPVNAGFNTGYFMFQENVVIINDGDVSTDLIIVIRAEGEVVNPKIIKDDAYVKLLLTLAADDELRIDLKDGRITLNGVNCIGKVDRLSSFTEMKIEPGASNISFDADSGDTNMGVFLYYTPRYLGV